MPSGGDPRNRLACDTLVVGSGKRLVGVYDVDAVQGDAAQLGLGWFVGADITMPEDLAGIHRNQLTVEPFGDTDGQLGLAAGRWSDDRYYAQVGYGRLNNRLNWSSGR